MNLFSSFDPNGLTISSNWLIIWLSPLFLPTSYWAAMNFTSSLISVVLFRLMSELSETFSPGAAPGLVQPFLALFSFIVTLNLLGLLPYVFTPTSHILMTLEVALPMWLGLTMYSWAKQSGFMFSHLVPTGTPLILSPLMVLIEVASSLIRPISLSVRLCANMTAGHLILALVSSPLNELSFLFIPMITVLSLILILESAVSLVQAYVFSVLMTLYYEESNSFSLLSPSLR